MKITIDLDRTDFEQLGTNTMRWSAGPEWREQAGRFSPMRPEDEINWTWFQWAHWYSDTTSMILARAYLTGLEEDYQVLIDEADHHAPYVILTNYSGPLGDIAY